MRFILIFILLTGIISFSKAQAQSKIRATPGEKKAQRTMDSKAFEAFNLTADQKEKIMAILIIENKSIDSLADTRPGGNFAILQVGIQDLNDIKILKLLNEDQQKTYVAYVQQRNSRALTSSNPPPAKPVITTTTDKKILALLNEEQKLIYAGVMQRRTNNIQTKPVSQ